MTDRGKEVGVKPRSYRLPGGEETPDVTRYSQEWARFYRQFLVLLPGWDVLSFDPGLTLADRGSRDRLQISVECCARIMGAHRAILENAVRLARPGAQEIIERVARRTAQAEKKRSQKP